VGGKIEAVVLAFSLILVAATLGPSTFLASADSSSSSTAPQIQWQHTYDIGPGAQTKDGGLAVAGSNFASGNWIAGTSNPPPATTHASHSTPALVPTLTFAVSPTPTSSPTLKPNLTDSPIITPSSSPTQQPTKQSALPNSAKENLTPILIIAALVGAIVVALLVYFAKHEARSNG
jgi:hypothetical protein